MNSSVDMGFFLSAREIDLGLQNQIFRFGPQINIVHLSQVFLSQCGKTNYFPTAEFGLLDRHIYNSDS